MVTLFALLGPGPLTYGGRDYRSFPHLQHGRSASLIPGILDFASGVCVLSAQASPAPNPRPAPAVGEAWYYLIKSRNACGPGTYGTAGRDTQPACP